MKNIIFVLVVVTTSLVKAGDQPKFFWGVANAAFQVEGSPEPSDWLTWSKTPGKIADGTNADRVSNFWNSYSKDFELAQDLGANSFRISLAWERIEPQKGQFNLEALRHYATMISEMKKKGLEPFVTLHHFVLPIWVSAEGGVLSPHFATDFANYAEKAVKILSQGSDGVKFWITFNEPNVLAMNGYVSGDWPPGIKGKINLALRAQFQMGEAHIQAYRKMKAAAPGIKIGIAHHWKLFQPATTNLLDKGATQLVDFLFDRYFINTITKGNPCVGVVSIMCSNSSLGHKENVLDFFGMNYYGRSLVSATSKPPFFVTNEGPGQKSDIGWEIYPKGIYLAAKEVNAYGRPILITENGVADQNDAFRKNFLKEHIAYLLAARREGIPVMGYLHWSLTDNFEWARGLSIKFGLVEMDYKTLQRTPRPSFYEFKKIISSTD